MSLFVRITRTYCCLCTIYVGYGHPDIRILRSHVTPDIPPEKWKDLGLELLNGNSNELNNIEADVHGTIGKINEMFDKWLTRREATWNELIVALENIHLTYLADKIRKNVLPLTGM